MISISKKLQFYLVLSLGLYLSLVTACDSSEEEICQDCITPVQKFTFTKDTFRYNKLNDHTLIYNDFYYSQGFMYSVCNPELLEPYNDKVLKISGFISSPCNSEDKDIITIEEFEVVNYCFDPIPESIFAFDIFNNWRFYSIETPDTTLFVPCDFHFPISVSFLEEKANYIFENYPQSFNIKSSYFSQGACNITNDSLFLLPGIINDTLPFIQTDAIAYWNKAFSELFTNDSRPEEAILTYEINNNVLTLSNPLTSIKATLYTGAN